MEEYGLRALLCLARKVGDNDHDAEGVTIPELADAEGLSGPYASKIMRKLRQGGLVSADRGRTGGYHLTRSPEQITLLQALEALGGPLRAVDHCDRYVGALDECVHKSECSIRGAFGGFIDYMEKILAGATLADLTRREAEVKQRINESAEAIMGATIGRYPASRD